MKDRELENAKLLRALLDLHIKTIETKDLASRLNGNDRLEQDLERLKTAASRVCGAFAQGQYANPEPSPPK